MMKQLLFSFTFLFHCTTILAQSPAQAPAAAAAAPTLPPPQPPAAATPILPPPQVSAPPAPSLPKPPALAPALAPAPANSIDIIKILKKARRFSLFIRLLTNTQVGDQINSQLQTSGLTVFAPTDGAFAALKTGTLNSLRDVQQVQLCQFHVLPVLLSTAQFQTASNPLRTQAGDTGKYDFPLNITTTSDNQVNVSTGLVNANLTDTIYSGNQLAVYEVDKVLLPMNIFGPKPPPSAPAPAPVEASPKSKPKTNSPAITTPTSTDDTTTATTSAAISLTISRGLIFMVSLGVGSVSLLV